MALPLAVLHETILVVDDNAPVLEIVTLSLKLAGFTVLSAASAAEARQIEAEFKGTIHLLVSDVNLFNTCGPDLAAGLKVQRPQMQVILMSGHPDDSRTRQYHFLRKPFLPNDLLNKVNEVLRAEIGGGHLPGAVV